MVVNLSGMGCPPPSTVEAMRGGGKETEAWEESCQVLWALTKATWVAW